MKLLERWFGHGLNPCLSQGCVLRLAQAAVAAECWEWLEPTTVRCRRETRGLVWTVKSNANARGCNIVVEILDGSGEILGRRFLRR